MADDDVTWMAHPRRRGADDVLIDALDLPVGGRALDLGCGPAARVGPTGAAVGLDRSAAMARAAGDASGSPTLVGDGRVLPFRRAAWS